MTELLLFKWDHSVGTPGHPVDKLALLPKPFDLIDFRPDGWRWGKEELANPWFRILAWTGQSDVAFQPLVSPQLPQFSAGSQTTLPQYRGFNLNLADPSLPANFAAWWADDSRAQAIFALVSALTPAQLSVPRAAVPAPVTVQL